MEISCLKLKISGLEKQTRLLWFLVFAVEKLLFKWNNITERSLFDIRYICHILFKLLMRLQRRKSRTCWLPMTKVCWLPIPDAASPRSSEVQDHVPDTRNLTVKLYILAGKIKKIMEFCFGHLLSLRILNWLLVTEDVKFLSLNVY